MGKSLYVIRHCKAEGQAFDEQLTDEGHKQAQQLRDLFSTVQVDRIISSPYTRALQSIKPLSGAKRVEIETDSRLEERRLSSKQLPDWLEKLESTFSNMDLAYEGGESSREATARVVQLMEECKADQNVESIIIVTHGNLMSLLLNHFSQDFGFEGWKKLSNPDVYVVQLGEDGTNVKRIWEERRK
ncbi:histidine phosphatase family protein [Pontibacillus yanchengensis]|uniref:Histidine phosphatase family protein n=1 Tax=Pontibacillus yanchengensis TaxID=462910 RepID=A0A6I4ZW80_9BACI|nr:histidine phosphatase family protein [Pontibacillus yanchengensis]MYL32577.1 histidine phosphatase family protein [Pontibacillus yanchengensis]